MTTEEDFQAALDANPDDHNTRLVFADWLQECAPCGLCKGVGVHRGGYEIKCVVCDGTGKPPGGDPRAEGYRALGANEMHPQRINFVWFYLCGSLRLPGAQWMPHDWYTEWRVTDHCTSRREAEDAAALAFAALSPERRAELLAVPVPAIAPADPLV